MSINYNKEAFESALSMIGLGFKDGWMDKDQEGKYTNQRIADVFRGWKLRKFIGDKTQKLNVETKLEEDSIEDFQEGQWWIDELDTLCSTEGITLDQKRAVAVVHKLLQLAHQTDSNHSLASKVLSAEAEYANGFIEGQERTNVFRLRALKAEAELSRAKKEPTISYETFRRVLHSAGFVVDTMHVSDVILASDGYGASVEVTNEVKKLYTLLYPTKSVVI